LTMESVSLKVASRFLRASWFGVKSFFPQVKSPLFHATKGTRAALIALKGQGLKADSGFSNFGQGNVASVSMSRDLSFLLQGHFGDIVFVYDAVKLSSRYKTKPVSYWHNLDEFEERVFTDHIPFVFIEGVVFNYEMRNYEIKEWSALDIPVLHLKDGNWVSIH